VTGAFAFLEFQARLARYAQRDFNLHQLAIAQDIECHLIARLVEIDAIAQINLQRRWLAFDRHDYGFLAEARCPVLIVQGERDEFGSGARAEEFARRLGERVEAVVIRGADHYFHGHFDELRRGIRDFLTRPAVARALERKRVETG